MEKIPEKYPSGRLCDTFLLSVFYYFCFPQSPRLLPMLCISRKKSEIAQITTTDGRNGWMMEIKGVGVCYVVLWVSSFVPKTWYSTMAMTLMSLCVCAKGLLTKVVSTSTHPKIYSRFSSSLSILKESWGIIIGPGITLVYCDILSCIKLAWKRFCSFQPSIYWTVVLLNSQSVWSHTNRKYTRRKILCVNVRTYNFVAKSNGNNLNNMSHTRFMRIYQDH